MKYLLLWLANPIYNKDLNIHLFFNSSSFIIKNIIFYYCTQLREYKRMIPSAYKLPKQDRGYSMPFQNLNHLNYFNANIQEFLQTAKLWVTLFPKAISYSLNRSQILKQHSYLHTKQKVILNLGHRKNLWHHEQTLSIHLTVLEG